MFYPFIYSYNYEGNQPMMYYIDDPMRGFDMINNGVIDGVYKGNIHDKER